MLYILALVQTHINTGDVLFQLIIFVIFLSISLAMVVFILILKNRNNRLKRIEEKLDRILSDKKR